MRSSQTTKKARMASDAIEQPDRASRSPADVGRLRDRVDEQREPAGDAERADRVEAPVAEVGVALGNDPRREREHERSDRDVDEEDPLPAEVLREDAAEEHADRGARAAERAPDAERLVAVCALLERRRHDRQGRRRDDRRAESLHGAREDQDAGAPREPARQRGEREEDEADDEDAPPPEQVGHAAAEQQEAAERDRVRGDHPLHRRLRDVQVFLNRRDRDVDDRNVEDRHEERRADDGENQPLVPVLFGHFPLVPVNAESAGAR